MSKKTRAERNLKFETLQLHVGQEMPEQFRSTRHHPMYSATVSMQQQDLVCQMQETFMED